MNDLDPSPDLHDLLDRVARPGAVDGATTSAAADLGRARSALRHRRRRTLSTGLGALTTLAVLGAGAAVVVTGSDDPDGTTAAPSPGTGGAMPTSTDRATASPDTEQVRLVAASFEAGPYTFDTTPQGWEVQQNGPSAVTIARVGYPDQEPDSFVGKLVIMFDEAPLGTGDRVTREGREMAFLDHEDGYVTASVSTRAGEPQGTVRIQFPADLGWTRDTALTFLSSVRVDQSVVPSVG